MTASNSIWNLAVWTVLFVPLAWCSCMSVGCSKHESLCRDVVSERPKTGTEAVGVARPRVRPVRVSRPTEECLADLESTNAAARIEAIGELKQAGKTAVPGLLSYIRKSSGAARTRAIIALGEIADVDACADLETILHDSENPLDARAKAALFGTMAKVGGPRYLELFRSELTTALDEDVQCAIAVALTDLGDRSGTEIFLRFLETKDGRAKTWAAKNLARLYKQDLGEDVGKWRAWLKKHSSGSGPN